MLVSQLLTSHILHLFENSGLLRHGLQEFREHIQGISYFYNVRFSSRANSRPFWIFGKSGTQPQVSSGLIRDLSATLVSQVWLSHIFHLCRTQYYPDMDFSGISGTHTRPYINLQRMFLKVGWFTPALTFREIGNTSASQFRFDEGTVGVHSGNRFPSFKYFMTAKWDSIYC